jgi:phosphoglycerate dehydrogenase-like enzyme
VLVTGLGTQTAAPIEFVRAMPRLRWIHSMTAGVDPLLSPEIAERGLLVTNAAGAYGVAIAEYAFAALVLLARRLPDLLLAGRRHEWPEHELGGEIAGKLVGIVGYGGIGRHLAQLCSGAGARVWGLRRRPQAGGRGAAERVLEAGGLDELLRSADLIVIAASLNASSRNLLGRRELALTKPGALLVNVSRGAVLDEAALLAALHEGRLAGAVLDVTRQEPLPADSPLWEAPNLWITPHISGGTRESRARVLEGFIANLRRYAAGQVEGMANPVDLALELEPGRAVG